MEMDIFLIYYNLIFILTIKLSYFDTFKIEFLIFRGFAHVGVILALEKAGKIFLI